MTALFLGFLLVFALAFQSQCWRGFRADERLRRDLPELAKEGNPAWGLALLAIFGFEWLVAGDLLSAHRVPFSPIGALLIAAILTALSRWTVVSRLVKRTIRYRVG